MTRSASFHGSFAQQLALALALATTSLLACDAENIAPKRFDGGEDSGMGPEGGAPDAGNEGSGLLVAPEAEVAATLELDAPVTDVIYAEDLPIGLHADGGASILDLSDPRSPQILSALQSDGRVVGVAIDVQLRLLFVVSVTGDLRVYRVSDPRNPTRLAQLSLSEAGGGADPIKGLVRVGLRLFVLGGANLLPVRIEFGSGSSVSLVAENPVALDADPRLVTTSAGVVYVVFRGGKVQVWSATSSPTMLDQANLGADVVGVVARGRRLFVALSGLGLRVVDMGRTGTLRLLYEAPELDDLTGLERFGNLVLVSLSRGLVIALDLSDFDAPRALVSRRGALPEWIAAIGGNLVLGSGTSLSVLGVPPFVAASFPAPMATSFPRYGRVPLQLSKPIDPSTVTLDNVTLRCGGVAITGSLSVSLDRLRITFLPADTLPAGVSCDLTLDGVLDALGLPLAMPQQGVSFSTAMAAPAVIQNPGSAFPHTADGEFSDWAPGMKDGFEYSDVTGAQGMYSRFYADFDGQKLWMLNDWFYNGDAIDPDCYNQFGVWTGGGSQWWEIRAYGDQRIEVRLNGSLLAEDDERVTGGYAFTASPNDPEEHTVYEIAITTEPGTWGVQLHDPGPTFSCQQLETDPINYAGSSTADGSTIDPTMAPTMPAEPEPRVTGIGTGTPTLSWDLGEGAAAFTTYVIELSTGDNLDNVFFRTVVYGGTLVLPPGLLQPGTQYTVRLTAYNLIGSVSSEPYTFTTPGGDEDPGSPTLSRIRPSSVTQGEAVSITITGEDFVEGARAYLDGEAVSTTYENGTTLVIMLTADDTDSAGTFDITVRNVPGDSDTESNARELTITEPQSEAVTLEGLDPDTLTAGEETTVVVTMTDAPDDTYTLVLTPGDLEFDCDPIGDNQCEADVTVGMAGSYDATIRVGPGDGDYDTNTLEDEVTVSAPGALTLVSLSPGTVTQNVVTSVDVTMTNAGSGTYYLILTHAISGDALEAVFCDYTSQSHCSATVNVATLGDYDAMIQIGATEGNNTNTVDDALSVVEPAVCAHDACLPGAALANGCDACVTAVCTGSPGCCNTAWSGQCVVLADNNGSCSCTPPRLAPTTTLTPATMVSGATTSVEVRLQNEPASGATYQLLLTHSISNAVTMFNCTGYDDFTHTCDASVTLAATGTYNAHVVVTISGQAYSTSVVNGAFTVTAVPSGPTCDFAATEVTPSSGSGTCGSPYLLDLSALSGGSERYVTIAGSNDNNESDVTLNAASTCVAGSGRDVVFQITFPDVGEVNLYSESPGNTILTVPGTLACNGTPYETCANQVSTAGSCEQILVDPNTTKMVIVSETAPSMAPMYLIISM